MVGHGPLTWFATGASSEGATPGVLGSADSFPCEGGAPHGDGSSPYAELFYRWADVAASLAPGP
jgi:hypothetical protein